MFRLFDWSAVTNVSKNHSAYILRLKPTMNRPVLPASVDTAQHRTGLDSSAATTSKTAHNVNASGNFNCGLKPVHQGTKMTRPRTKRLADFDHRRGGTVSFVFWNVMTQI